MGTAPEDIQATFCATIVDEWARAGVGHAVVSPGSRSTPLALALATDGRLTVHVHVDERSAGFLALGLAQATGRPTVVLTTSGTAAVELHPAVVEADLAGVPLLVCTADRPPELFDVGAPQAIDQVHLFGRSVRWFGAPGVADPATAGRWRPLAARAHAEAIGAHPGPVHLNLAFREPLLGTPADLPAGRSSGSRPGPPGGGPTARPRTPDPWPAETSSPATGRDAVAAVSDASSGRDAVTAVSDASSGRGAVAAVSDASPGEGPWSASPGDGPRSRGPETGTWTARGGLAPVAAVPWTVRSVPAPADPVVDIGTDLAGRRGVIVAGAGSGPGEPVAQLARALGWPVLASPQAPVWSAAPDVVVAAPDAILRVEAWREALRPDLVVRLGAPLASRVVGEWLAATGAAEVVVAGPVWSDPSGTAAVVVEAPVAAVVERWLAQLVEVPSPDPSWGDAWRGVGERAAAAVVALLSAAPQPTEPGLAQAVADALPAGANLVLSSSMPVRDVEWYVRPPRPLTVWANRGANGIDGVVSTAVGLAAGTGRPTALLIGDIAFLHDTNGLLGATGRGVDLTIVVADNDGGGIFSFLPQADGVDGSTFESLFGTPHGLDLVALAAGFGVPARAVEDLDGDLATALAAGPGVRVLVLRTDRAANRDVHARLNRAVAEGLGRPPAP